jgi:hypothetical protein
LLLPVQIVQDVIAVWMFRRTYSAWNLKVMMPGAFIGVGLAWLLASHVSDNFIRFMLGVVSILFVLHAWLAPTPTADEHPPTAPAGLFWGTCAAFTSAICQAGNPPFQIFVLRQNLDKLTYVGTFRDVLRGGERAEGGPLFRARPVHGAEFRRDRDAVPARGCGELSWRLACQAHADDPVLPDRPCADLPDLAGIDPQRPPRHAAGLEREAIRCVL